MSKRALLAAVLVFLAWNILDFLLHGVLLMGIYTATQDLWRPMEEMKQSVMQVSVAVRAILFCLLYDRFISRRTFCTALSYALIWGLAAGVGMASSYAWMPIPGSLAWGWLAGSVVEGLVAGAILGAVVKQAPAAA